MTTAVISREFIRFLVVGASNTLVAYGAYLLLVNWLPYPIAWGFGYLLGIGSGYVANALFVFKKPLRGKSALAFFCVYLAQYLVSILLLKVALEVLMLPHWLAAIGVIVLTIPPTFLFIRIALNSR
ncbi:MAG: GtrA family protein [Steroidobacteraceae bacterium]